MNEQFLGELELLAGEVIANAIMHTGAPCVVCVRWAGERLRVEVTDIAAIVPSPGSAGPEDEGGRGLFLVNALAEAWGAVPDPAGKTTWIELAVPTAFGDTATGAPSHVETVAGRSVVNCSDPTPACLAGPVSMGSTQTRLEYQAA